MSCQDPAALETLPYSAHLDNEEGVELIFCFCFHHRYSCWRFSVHLYSFHCSPKTQANVIEILLVFLMNVFLPARACGCFYERIIRFMYVNWQPQTVIYRQCFCVILRAETKLFETRRKKYSGMLTIQFK